MLHVKHLKPFMAVVRHGNLSRASEELRRAQSAVSRSIQELESWFGVSLFERGPRQWLLTKYGQVLARRTEEAFAELQRACVVLTERHPACAARLRAAPFFSLSVHERRLELLFAFAERKHISTAAATVGISQPAASMALYDIESSVGIPLFDRAHTGVALNECGELLMEHVKRALALLRLADGEISALEGVVDGLVVVGALPFSRPYVLPAAIGEVLRQHPHLQVRTLEAPMEVMITGLRLGDVDFLTGALPLDPVENGLVVEELVSEPMAVIARSDHPLAAAPSLDLSDLLDTPWILSRPGTPSREALNSCLAQQGVAEPRVAVESSDISVIRGLLLETDMITAASRQLFSYELKAGSLITLPVSLPGTERPIGILRRSPEHSSPGAKLLLDAVRRICQNEALADA